MELSAVSRDAEKLHITAAATSSAIKAARKANHITQLVLKLKNLAGIILFLFRTTRKGLYMCR